MIRKLCRIGARCSAPMCARMAAPTPALAPLRSASRVAHGNRAHRAIRNSQPSCHSGIPALACLEAFRYDGRRWPWCAKNENYHTDALVDLRGRHPTGSAGFGRATQRLRVRYLRCRAHRADARGCLHRDCSSPCGASR